MKSCDEKRSKVIKGKTLPPLTPGLELLFLETKQGCPRGRRVREVPLMLGVGASCLLPRAGSGEGADQGFSWEPELPRKISQDVDSLHPSNKGNRTDERESLGPVSSCVLRCWPPQPTHPAF